VQSSSWTVVSEYEGNQAVGVDEVTKTRYGPALEANLQELSARLKRMGYRPQPKRRVYIPKPGSEKGRPLGISCFEDKSVERAPKRGWSLSLSPDSKPVATAIVLGALRTRASMGWDGPSRKSV
jgi:hypothetical protein